MGADALGGGVLVAAAAVLWLAYLLPTWLHRRQYLTSERNAVRLQQTLRALAETAEAPQQIAVEATARAAVTQSKILRERENAARELVKAEAAAAATTRRAEDALRIEKVRAEAARVAANPVLIARARLRTLRRARGITALALLASLVAVIAGAIVAAVGGPAVLLSGGLVVGVAAFFTLGSLAKAGRVAAKIARATPAAPAAPARFTPVEFAPRASAPQSWTPRPLPKPAYLERGSVAAAARASVDAAAELRRAAARAALLEKAAALDAETAAPAATVTALARPAAPAAPSAPAVPSRFAAMGMVNDAAPGMGDLDAVLRRRRAAG
ncbi:hypothetical protein [Microterricola pindariensis]|uniref:Large exoprotein n=1 Tax=Microterricola pindariensis TaxID=478010 RepID=A0ABX5AY78_9MICO|nr:hypothetical protein [Microterricola pindariensis]PPL19757.1 hypothetical protein GY24_04660 [Microterricola pindariensis]